jgi:hypothetical protein
MRRARALWRPHPAANPAMMFGTASEPVALRAYCGLMPCHHVDERYFAVLGEGPAHSWLGASPDGIITVEAEAPDAGSGGGGGAPRGAAAADVALVVGAGSGVLEIKCPHKYKNRASGAIELNGYYMPQAS